MDAQQYCLMRKTSKNYVERNKRGTASKYNVTMLNRRGAAPVTSSESLSQSQSRVARRWTVIASGLLLLALALVVIYTGPSAFYSPSSSGRGGSDRFGRAPAPGLVSP